MNNPSPGEMDPVTGSDLVTTLPPSALPVLIGDLFDGRWQRLVGGWLAQYRPVTASAYKTDLGIRVTWAVARGLTRATAGPGDIGAWVRTLEVGGARLAGIARKLAALSSFYTWAVDENAIPRSPVVRVRRPHVVDDAQPLGLDRDQATRLSSPLPTPTPETTPSSACSWSTASASAKPAQPASRTSASPAATSPSGSPEKADAKRSSPSRPTPQTRSLPSAPAALPAPLLRDYDGHPLDRHDAARIVRRLARRAGLPPTSPHAFVAAAFDTGAPLRDVQDAAGHADPRTTRRYDRTRYNLDRHPTYAVATHFTT